MTHHELKIEEPYFEAVCEGRKTFEIRLDDRGYQAGDTVELYVPGYASKCVHAKIGYVTSFHQEPGWVVFSLLNVRENP
jgi:ASC-1-like (ASCH) protein